MRRPLVLVILGTALSLVAAGCVGFSVTKETTGDNPPSGDFVVQIVCDNDDPPAGEDLTFAGDEEFPQTQQSNLYDFVLGGGTCTISETDPANALSTTIECVDPNPELVTCTPQEDGSLEVEVDFGGIPGFVEVGVLVTNDLGAAPTTTTTIPVDPLPTAIVAEPLFTA
jgi:hypothetical protein